MFETDLWGAVLRFSFLVIALIVITAFIAFTSKGRERSVAAGLAVFMTAVLAGIIIVTWYYGGSPKF